MRKCSLIAALALLVMGATRVNAQTTENASGVNAVNAYGLLAHFPSINVRYTCAPKGGGGVVVEYTDGDGVMHFSPVLTGACTYTASGPTYGNGQVHSINFTDSETVTLGGLTIAVNPASFTVYSGACVHTCQWFAEPGYDISITTSTVTANLPDGPAAPPRCPCPCICVSLHGHSNAGCPHGQCAKRNGNS